jgi:hypothetical protein
MNERLSITICVLVGFFITVMFYMFAPMDSTKTEVLKLVMTSEGTACAICLGFWFSPKS